MIHIQLAVFAGLAFAAARARTSLVMSRASPWGKTGSFSRKTACIASAGPVALLPSFTSGSKSTESLARTGQALEAELEALPALTRAATSCYALRFPVEQMRAVRDLGVAREATGDRAGACEAWQRVLDRWGRATPRSVTAEDARARMRALGCG